ncbi:MAG: hypothetical protein QJR12_05160 [Mycobacterium sp.]|nr:hypothetical protein [Mycobacterium sp.]
MCLSPGSPGKVLASGLHQLGGQCEKISGEPTAAGAYTPWTRTGRSGFAGWCPDGRCAGLAHAVAAEGVDI